MPDHQPSRRCDDPRLDRLEQKIDQLLERQTKSERLLAVEVQKGRTRDRDQVDLKASVDRVEENVEKLVKIESERKGGRKALMALTSAVSAFIALVISWWQSKTGK